MSSDVFRVFDYLDREHLAKINAYSAEPGSAASCPLAQATEIGIYDGGSFTDWKFPASLLEHTEECCWDSWGCICEVEDRLGPARDAADTFIGWWDGIAASDDPEFWRSRRGELHQELQRRLNGEENA